MPSKLSSVLLAVIVTYLLTTMLTPEPIPAVFGDTSDSGGDHLLIATGKMANLEADVLYVLDERTQKLAVYLARGNALEMLAVRDCSYDFQLIGYGEQKPDLKTVKEHLQKAQKKSNAKSNSGTK